MYHKHLLEQHDILDSITLSIRDAINSDYQILMSVKAEQVTGDHLSWTTWYWC